MGLVRGAGSSDKGPVAATHLGDAEAGDWTRPIIVVGHYRVRRGSGSAFELAFFDRPRRTGPRPPVREVHFASAKDDPTRYLRVSVWRSLKDWDDHQGSSAQEAFWFRVHQYLIGEPQFEFYNPVGG